jgi:hypothetical protein
MLSLSFVLRRSTNFTSPAAIRMPPAVPINHYLKDSQTNETGTEVLFHYSMRNYSGDTPALSTLIFSK